MIVVIGSTGTVGSRLVDLLVQRDAYVRAVSRDATTAKARFPDGVEIAQADLDDPGALRAALTGADRVFLLTGRAPEPGRQLQRERNVITAAVDAGVAHVVKLSAHGADDSSPMQYARWHRAAERDLVASGLGFTILRPTGFIQNVLEWVHDGRFFTCAEDGRSAPVDVRDIAAVAAAALTEDGHLGRTYTLTGPAALSYDEVAATLSAVGGQPVTHVRVSADQIVAAMTGAGLPQWLGEDIAAQFTVFARQGREPTTGDVAAVLGRPPRSFARFAHDEFAPTVS